MRGIALRLGCAAALAVLAGCGEDVSTADVTPTPSPGPSETPVPTATPGPVPTPAPVTFGWVQAEVLERSCASATCHGMSSDAPMMTYAEVVNAPTQKGDLCDGRMRVVPGDLAASTLYGKLMDPTPCGARMPKDQPPLPPEVIDMIQRWILAGAPDDPA